MAGRVDCPGCSGVLRPWGWARPRRVHGIGGVLRPRRGRCGGCRVTHVLLPVTVLLRRAYAAEVIGAALLARAGGHGYRWIGAVLEVPVATVGGWLRVVGGLRPVGGTRQHALPLPLGAVDRKPRGGHTRAGPGVGVPDRIEVLVNTHEHDDDVARRARAQQVALFRYQLICPALDPSLSTKARGRVVRATAAGTHAGPFGGQCCYSRDTLDRWIRRYRVGGFDALTPSVRQPGSRIDTTVLELAVALKRENPQRTAAQVVRILRASSGWAPSESTLLRLFHRRELMGPAAGDEPAVFGRFEAAAPNERWVGDALLAGRRARPGHGLGRRVDRGVPVVAMACRHQDRDGVAARQHLPGRTGAGRAEGRAGVLPVRPGNHRRALPRRPLRPRGTAPHHPPHAPQSAARDPRAGPRAGDRLAGQLSIDDAVNDDVAEQRAQAGA